MADMERENGERRTDWIGSDGQAPVSAHEEDSSASVPVREEASIHETVDPQSVDPQFVDSEASSFGQEDLQAGQVETDGTGVEGSQESYESQADMGSQQGTYESQADMGSQQGSNEGQADMGSQQESYGSQADMGSQQGSNEGQADMGSQQESYGSQADIGSQQEYDEQPRYNWQQGQGSYRSREADRQTEDSYRGPSFSGGTEGIGARNMHARSKKEGFWRRLVAAAVVFGLVASLVFSGTNYLTGKISGKTRTAASVNSSSGPLSQTVVTDGGTTDVATIAANVMPAIVQVTNVSIEQYRSIFGQSQNKESTSAGSGIIVSQDDAYTYIATNNHVVANSSELTITFVDGKTAAAQVVGVDAQHDLAVVKVKTSDMDSSTVSAIKIATLGDSDSAKVGQAAIVIGNALGYGQSVTTGVISAKEREVTLKDDSGNKISNKLIQTDAAVNPGNSGGALLNSNGQVIGIVSAKYSDTSVEGMGYAIPISQAKTIIDDLMQNGSKTSSDSSKGSNSGNSSGNSSGDSSAGSLPSGSTYLGIAGADISSSQASQYNVPAGIYISKVSEGSPAQQAGLAKGDIITGVDDSSIGSMQDLKSLISGKKAGDQIKIRYASRADNYKSKTVTVTLATVQ
ncbi:trypsin-like peptidase domain-containing protein [Shuttleworthella satelles]|uniref:trypsin-like peptidase domain-containing protein n=1 Tax=Shuttleworthella satelles TaxID=177972 RepID=UPI0028D75DEC|nr:trypsin-like peptidase domain-containing protein [Shuttleworthia satelles]